MADDEFSPDWLRIKEFLGRAIGGTIDEFDQFLDCPLSTDEYKVLAGARNS